MKYGNHKLLAKPKKTTKVNLKHLDPNDTAHKSKDEIEMQLSDLSNRMSKLQHMLFADNSQSLLIILQGVDASGKDGTIRHVMGELNPQGCRVESFKVPNIEELSHDYLWRIHKVIPAKGQITIFNRSHYEDVIEVYVDNSLGSTELFQRYRQINDFERYLSENHVKILKFFLHISKDEQKKRLQERIRDPTKRWKTSEGDFKSHKYWDEYMKAYQQALSSCSKKRAPWYIIPANQKWYRIWAVAKIIVKSLEDMKMKYPEPKIDLSKLTID